MDIAEAKMRCNKIINDNNEIIREARKNGDINTIQLTASLDNDSIAIETVLNELEKKDLIINEMATTLSSVCTGIDVIIEQFNKKYCEFINSDEDCCWKTDKECSDCIKEYFTNKAENVGE